MGSGPGRQGRIRTVGWYRIGIWTGRAPSAATGKVRETLLPDLGDKSPAGRGPAADLWRRTLAQIPTVFGRLAYLTSLRDSSTGRYSHAALTNVLGEEDAERALRHSHHQVFSQWLGFSLADQKADLDEYLRATGRPREAHYYRHLAPPTARDIERQLYLTDLETLLELLKFEQGGVFLIREA